MSPPNRGSRLGFAGRSPRELRRSVDYVDVTAFDKQAEACAEHLRKGRQVAVDGRLSYSQWEAEDGSKRSRLTVIGNVQFLGGKPSEGGSSEQPAEGEPVVA